MLRKTLTNNEHGKRRQLKHFPIGTGALISKGTKAAPSAFAAEPFFGMKEGEERAFGALKMKFRWCPAGVFTMGQVIGATTARTEQPVGGDYIPQNLLATLYQKVFGINHATYGFAFVNSRILDQHPTIDGHVVRQRGLSDCCQRK